MLNKIQWSYFMQHVTLSLHILVKRVAVKVSPFYQTLTTFLKGYCKN